MIKHLQFVSTIVDLYSSYNRQKKVYMLAATAGLFFVLLGGMVWYISESTDAIVQNIKTLQRLKKKNAGLVAQYQKIQEEEEAFIALLHERKEMSIKTYFEKFIKENNLTPEGNWAETEKVPFTDNELFEEELLRATFKGMTAEAIVQLLQKIDKENVVEVQSIVLRKEQQLIGFDLVLAMKQFKKVTEEA